MSVGLTPRDVPQGRGRAEPVRGQSLDLAVRDVSAREAVEVAGVDRHRVQLAGRVLAERREARDLERLAPDAVALPLDDPQAPDVPGAVVAVEVAADGRP